MGTEVLIIRITERGIKEMKPSHVSRELRRIASKIDGSTNPSSKLAAHDIRKVLENLDMSDEDLTSDEYIVAVIVDGSVHDVYASVSDNNYERMSQKELVNILNSNPNKCAKAIGGGTGAEYVITREYPYTRNDFYAHAGPYDAEYEESTQGPSTANVIVQYVATS